jgi:hypothetical protein
MKRIKIKKRSLSKGLTFFPALCKQARLLQWDWLSWRVIHRPHPEYCLSGANSNTCSVRDASFWIEHEGFTSLPSFDWFYSEHIWTEGSANLYTECTADAVLFANIRKYCDWHLIHSINHPCLNYLNTMPFL